MGTSGSGPDSARRALELLLAFTEDKPVASVRQLAERIGVPAPSVHRYVALLRDMGLIVEGARGQYHLSMRVSALYRSARQAMPIVDIAEPLMRELSEELQETVVLIRLVNGLPVCIHRVEAPTPIRIAIDIGQQLPPLRGASVRLLVGDLAKAERERFVDRALASGALPPVHGRDEFLKDVEIAADRGWATSNEETREGSWTASAAVKQDGRTVAALTTHCVAFLTDDAKRAVIVELLEKFASRISDGLHA